MRFKGLTFLLYILSIILFTSCRSIEGLYVLSSNHPTKGYSEQQLFINMDGSFTYYPELDEYLIYNKTIGTWDREGNFLILNSSIQDTSNFVVKESFNADISADSILIEIYDMIEGVNIQDFPIALFEKRNMIWLGATNEEGKIIIPKNMEFDLIVLSSESYKTSQIKGNLLRIYIKQFPYAYFINSRYKIQKGKLLYKSNGYEYEYVKR